MERGHGLAGVVLVAATPVVAWWAVGDLSTVSDHQADYLLRPPQLSWAAEQALGVGTSVALLAAVGVLIVGTVQRRIPGRWWAFVAPLAALGAFVGFSFRVATAGVIGANIGGGMVIMVAPFLTTAALVLSAWSWRRLRPLEHHRR